MAQVGLYACPACGGDCTNGTCTAFVTNDCVDAVVNCESEICTIFISCPDDTDSNIPEFKPADWTVTADWEAAIASGLNKVYVIGDLAEPTQESRRISKNRTKLSTKTFTLNISIDEWTVGNYDAMRNYECGKTLFIGYQTLGGITFGGDNLIKCEVTKAYSPLARGENSYKTIELEVQWDSDCHPPATDQVDLL